MVHYSFSFTAYKAASGGSYLRCGTAKVSQGVCKQFPWDNKKVAHNFNYRSLRFFSLTFKSSISQNAWVVYMLVCLTPFFSLLILIPMYYLFLRTWWVPHALQVLNPWPYGPLLSHGGRSFHLSFDLLANGMINNTYNSPKKK